MPTGTISYIASFEYQELLGQALGSLSLGHELGLGRTATKYLSRTPSTRGKEKVALHGAMLHHQAASVHLLEAGIDSRIIGRAARSAVSGMRAIARVFFILTRQDMVRQHPWLDGCDPETRFPTGLHVGPQERGWIARKLFG